MKRICSILLIGLIAFGGTAGMGQTLEGDDFLLLLLPALIATQQANAPRLSADISVNISQGGAPLRVQFDAGKSTAGTQELSRYTWDFGDGHSAEGVSASNLYEVSGLYIATLTIRDTAGNSDQASMRIEVLGSNKSPAAVLKLSFENDFAPKRVEFDGTSSYDMDGDIVKYAWVFGDGNVGSGSKVTHIYDSIGFYTQYTARLTVTDNRGANSSAVQQIFVNQSDLRPVASFNATVQNGVAPLDVRFDASSSSDADGYLTEYLWDFGDGFSGVGLRPKHRYQAVGTFQASLTVKDNSEASSTINREIVVLPGNSSPQAVFTFLPMGGETDSPVDFDASASFDADGLITHYTWDFGDGLIGFGISPAHEFKQAGTYRVTLVTHDNSGAVGSITHELVVTGGGSQTSEITITTPGGLANSNPVQVQGSSPANAELEIHLNDRFIQGVRADEDGLWQLDLALEDGLNHIEASIAGQGSEDKYSIVLVYVNMLPRDLTGLSVSDVLVLTPGVPAIPYTVKSGNIEVRPGGKLILQAGTEIQFDGGRNSTLQVNGDLETNGRPDRRVLLTSDYLDDNGVPKRWAGIRASGDAGLVSLTNTLIEYAETAVHATGTQVKIKDSEIRNGGLARSILLRNIARASSIEGSVMSSDLYVSGSSVVYARGNTFAPISSAIDLWCTNSGCPRMYINQNNFPSSSPLRLNDNVFGNLWWRTKVDAQQNWWGTTDLNTIYSRRGADNVDFRNFLDGPVPGGQIYHGEAYGPGGSLTVISDGETVLGAGQHYTAHSDIHIPDGATLRLEAGAVLKLDNDILSEYDLVIDGRLVMEAGARIELAGLNEIKINGDIELNGTQQGPVVFTSAQEIPAKEDWKGILISDSARLVQIEHAIVEYAEHGLRFENASGSVRNSQIRNNKVGVYIKGESSPLITGNTITSNDYGIVETSFPAGAGPDSIVSGNNLHDNSRFAAQLRQHGGRSAPRLMPGNWWGSADINDLERAIYDYQDDDSMPVIDFRQYLNAPIASGQPVNAGAIELLVIQEDTLLTEDEAYAVIGDIYVPQGVTLTLDVNTVLDMSSVQNGDFDLIVDGQLELRAGSKLMFSNHDQLLQINGALKVEGTQVNPVVFTSGRAAPTAGDWMGIHITALAGSVLVSNAVIEYAQRGIWFDDSQGVVSQSQFRYNMIALLASSSSTPQLSGNQFTGNVFDIQSLPGEIDGLNALPLANFTAAQNDEGASYTVIFDGSTSTDQDAPILAYRWGFGDGASGSGMMLEHRYLEAGTYTVSLTVLDSQGALGVATQQFSTNTINSAPIAEAGEDQEAIAGETVGLDGSGSIDNDGRIVKYRWVQTHGVQVDLSSASLQSPVFTMPELEAGEILSFEMTVTDNLGASASDSVTVTLVLANIPPVAYAGPDRRIDAGKTVILKGYGDDKDGMIETYAWEQLSGPTVTLEDAGSATASFEMPVLALNQELVFQLTVSDNLGSLDTDTVTIGRVKEVTLYSNVSSGIPPLNVFFIVDTNSPYPATAYGMDYDGDGTIDETATKADDFEYVYELVGTYHPYVSMLDDQGVFHVDRITIEVVSAEDEQALIKTQWDAMVAAMQSGDIETAMAYFIDSAQDEYRVTFSEMSSEKLNAIFANVIDLELYTLSDHLANCGALRTEFGTDYSYPVVFMRDGNGGWKIASL